MKSMIVIALFVTVVAAIPVDDTAVKTLSSAYTQEAEGGYVYNFETENGIARSENGEIKQTVDDKKQPHSFVIVRGTYSYTSPEGQKETVSYYADETGYHPEVGSKH